MMRVDQPRNDDVPIRAYLFVGMAAGLDFRVRANVFDLTVLLVECAVTDDFAGAIV